MSKQVFNRREIKYILTKDNYKQLVNELKDYIVKDKYHKTKICNIYFDTSNFDLVSHSIDKPLYKEKVRLRSYNIPKMKDFVFLEIKKKFDGIVNKRRIKLKLEDFYSYINNNQLQSSNKQIKDEIDYCFKTYDLEPKMFIAYDRLSFVDKNNNNFRITFDCKIRSRENNLKLELGDYGDKYFENDEVIMEVKALSAFPMWFVKVLSNLDIKPTSFSKYGSIYKKKRKVINYV